MLQIQNIGEYFISMSTSYMGGQGRPLYIKLRSGTVTFIQQAELSNWPGGAKQNLADYVQKGQLRVNEAVCVHNVVDEGHTLPPQGAFDEASAITSILAFADVYNAHVLNDSIHTAKDPGNAILGPAPTDVATLLVYITAAQGKFNAHIAAGVHPNADILNAVSAAHIDLPTAIDAIKEFYGRFDGHKKQLSAGGPVLSPGAIIAY